MTELTLYFPRAFAGLSESLRAAFTALQSGIYLQFHEFVPFGILASELLAGAFADVFISANVLYMADLWRAGRISSPQPLASNRLCIIVLANQATAVSNLISILDPGLRLVTPQPETDPCSQYVIEMWRKAGLENRVAEKTKCGELIHSRGSGDLPEFLFDGRVDAGIFYASEAVSLGDQVPVVPIDQALDGHEEILFTIGALSRGGAPAQSAIEMVRFMTGNSGQLLLQQYGFTPLARISSVLQPLPWNFTNS